MIDRKALVSRHNVTLTRHDPLTPLSLGNGEFAFTADLTGLQSYPELHATKMQLGTQAQWGWHSEPNPQGYTLEQALTLHAGIPYPDQSTTPAGLWLRANPHRLHLGLLGFIGMQPEALEQPRQTLHLWAGRLESTFRWKDQRVKVETFCHPTRDGIGVRISPGTLPLALRFPGPSTDWLKTADETHPERHTTHHETKGARTDFERVLDETRYHVSLVLSAGTRLIPEGPHQFRIEGTRGTLELGLFFSAAPLPARLPTVAETQRAAASHWERFWSKGGALELAGSTDPRAGELERRVVLSQFLTAIHCAGSLPPQETGLVQNSWHGKFHLEMHWWHAAHFALWGREALLERSLPYYKKILPQAQETARRQGFRGARWPKMVGPDGRESPSPVGAFLLWQQPHPIFFAELLYRRRPTRATLEKYQVLVGETAAFLASYAATGQLGPTLIPAQESYKPGNTLNPTFELAYVWWALETAQHWRERLKLPREPEWERVKASLPKPQVQEGLYTAISTPPYTLTRDHPSLVGALGMLPPTPLIEPERMRRTLLSIEQSWDWPSTWGWDYPLLAMTATRLGLPEKALDFLLLDTPKNHYLANGHNYQRPNLPLYLPGNGGLLYATALMALQGGFPQGGKWHVRAENLHEAL